ncbi:MAG: 50S ribosomal protein L4 [Sedimentisphaerales bacterium]|nr:50S ribosomal protein L4 [Sedimentisphaerales bacterium]
MRTYREQDMIELPVKDKLGQTVETISIDESILGGKIRFSLLKQALVRYHANCRVGTAATKNKALVEGSTRKLYRQKHTGRARAGQIRTHKRVGGGVAFAKVARDFDQDMPKRQRRLARDCAILAKLRDNQVVVINELAFERPKTKEMAGILRNLGINRSCIVATKALDQKVYLAARNIPKVSVVPASELSAGPILLHEKILFTKDALLSFLDRSAGQA